MSQIYISEQKLEYRGYEVRESKKGNDYYLLNFEDVEGKVTQFCTREEKVLKKVKKGQSYFTVLDINMNGRYTNIFLKDVKQ